jgi:hypothetical protein
MMFNRQALLIGRNHNLAWALPSLLARAAFHVDVITSSSAMRWSRFVRDCDVIPSSCSLLSAISQRMQKRYDWVIPTEDGVLQEIVNSSLSIEEKLKILPVRRKENFAHLYSNIGLSQTLAAHGISTPPFFVACNLGEALLGAHRLGYPVLIKRSASCGGAGVFEYKTVSDLRKIPRDLLEQPFLVQKKIAGIEIDLSAIYLEEDLVHFNYARPEKVCCHQFGPSFLRTYQSLSRAEEPLFRELEQIGKALGAHGFTNIGCIESFEGRRFYFEVDMRPNVWVDFPRFLGEDPSFRIRKWFSQKEKLSYPVLAAPHFPQQIAMPYFLRLRRWELFFNRYRVWRFIPKEDKKLILRLILYKLFPFGRINSWLRLSKNYFKRSGLCSLIRSLTAFAR